MRLFTVVPTSNNVDSAAPASTERQCLIEIYGDEQGKGEAGIREGT